MELALSAMIAVIGILFIILVISLFCSADGAVVFSLFVAISILLFVLLGFEFSGYPNPLKIVKT